MADEQASKPTVVLDLGSVFIKCGFAGESAPRYIIPSPLDEWLQEARAAAWRLNEWVNVLGPLLVKVYIQYLRCKAKDRRVLICEPLIGPASFREALAHVLFRWLRVSSILIVPALTTALYTTGGEGGLIVDVGYRESHVLAIAHGRPLLNTYQVVGVGSRHLLKRVKELLGEEDLGVEAAQDIAVRCCFARSRVPDPRPVNGVEHDGLMISPEIRGTVAEVFFSGDEDSCSLPVAILKCLARCPRDVRRMVAGHVLVTGGGSMLPGFCRRLTEEVQLIATSNQRYEQLRPVVEKGKLCIVKDVLSPRNILTWVGGSILAILEETIDMSLFISRSAYLAGDVTVPEFLALKEDTESN